MDKIEKNELATSLLKVAVNTIPYIGNMMAEAIEYRSKVKQTRVNNFVVLLGEYFGHNPLSDTARLKSEEFGDLFESVLKRVSLTSSQDKLKRFRDIVVNFISAAEPTLENPDLYLDLINALDEKAIFILTCHQKFDKAYYTRSRKIQKLQADKVSQKGIFGINMETDRDIAALERQNQGLTQYRKASHYGISESKFLYYKQILFAKGLLHDDGLGNLNVVPFDTMGLTEFGHQFIEFIMCNSKEESEKGEKIPSK